MHGLEVVGSEHEDHEPERRMGLDALLDPGNRVAARLVRVLPCGTASIQAVLDDPDAAAAGQQVTFQDARPARVELETLPRVRDDAPRERVAVDEDLVAFTLERDRHGVWLAISPEPPHPGVDQLVLNFLPRAKIREVVLDLQGRSPSLDSEARSVHSPAP